MSIIIPTFDMLTKTNTDMEYIVLSSGSPSDLSRKVNDHIVTGWKPVGSHQVVTTHKQNRFRGTELVDSLYQHEYTQTMVK
jgi:hypothetical protein